MLPASKRLIYSRHRWVTPDNYLPLAELAPNTTTYTDQNRTPEIIYYYRLTAKNSGGSSVAATLTTAIPLLPAVNETEFIIERGSSGADFTEIGRVSANVQTFVDSTVVPLTLYDYRVKAIHSAGASFYSNTARINLAVGLSAAAQRLGAQISLYPNPGKDRLQLKLDNKYRGKLNITIRNMSGGVVYKSSFTKQRIQWQTTLDLKELPAGIYLIGVNIGGIKAGKRWVKLW